MKRLSLITLSLLLFAAVGLAQDHMSLTGSGSATGIDYYGTGLYDFLGVSIGVNTDFGSYYSYSITLADKNGTVLAQQSGMEFISSPTGTLNVYFDGTVIGQNGVDGPYYLKDLSMKNLFGLGSLYAALAYTTPPFLASQFPGYTRKDTIPPTVSVSANPNMLWPADHKMHEITVDVIATDDQDPNPVVTFESVTSNQNENVTGAGNTSNDIMLRDGRIFLRAERAGSLNEDRVYIITYSARDASGNIGSGFATVTVPHDNRN